MSIIGTIFMLAIVIFIIAALWRLFEKAGHPGWAAIVPIYNMYILTKMADKPGYFVLLMFIPIVSIIIMVIVWHQVVLRFGKDALFTVGVILLGIVFIPILAFGDATYKGTLPKNDGVIDDLLME